MQNPSSRVYCYFSIFQAPEHPSTQNTRHQNLPSVPYILKTAVIIKTAGSEWRVFKIRIYYILQIIRVQIKERSFPAIILHDDYNVADLSILIIKVLTFSIRDVRLLKLFGLDLHKLDLELCLKLVYMNR